MENQEKDVLPVEKKNKSLKWLWILIAALAVAGIAVWCTLSAIYMPNIKKDGTVVEGVENVFGFGETFVLFTIVFAVFIIVSFMLYAFS